MSRNFFIEITNKFILNRVDQFIEGRSIGKLPIKKNKKQIDDFIADKKSGGSVILATIFLIGYSVTNEEWDFKSIPVGIRGTYGDKLLSSEFKKRFITIHKSITAFGENLGWKGNVSKFDLSNDSRFQLLKSFKNSSKEERENVLDYFLWLAFDSIKKPKVIPRVDDSYLTYGRSVELFTNLIKIQSEGHIQQFLIAGILKVHRDNRSEIRTHHPHASDKFDNSAGDIEEFDGKKLVAAYEITVRDDWKNRIQDFMDKMIQYNLKKYVIIADNVRGSDDLGTAKDLLSFTESIGFDLAVVDIFEFINVFCAELSAKQLQTAINVAYQFLMDEKLCGRFEIIEKYRRTIDDFLAS